MLRFRAPGPRNRSDGDVVDEAADGYALGNPGMGAKLLQLVADIFFDVLEGIKRRRARQRRFRLLDWRGFGDRDTKAISCGGCRFGGGGSFLRGRVAGAVRRDSNGVRDRFAERADKYSAGEGFETGLATDGGKSEARCGIWGREERGREYGERQPGQRRPVLPGKSDREGEQPVAACAAGFREYAGGARRRVRVQGHRWDVCARVQHFPCEGNGSGRREGQNRARGSAADFWDREKAWLHWLFFDGVGQPGRSLRGDGWIDRQDARKPFLEICVGVFFRPRVRKRSQ